MRSVPSRNRRSNAANVTALPPIDRQWPLRRERWSQAVEVARAALSSHEFAVEHHSTSRQGFGQREQLRNRVSDRATAASPDVDVMDERGLARATLGRRLSTVTGFYRAASPSGSVTDKSLRVRAQQIPKFDKHPQSRRFAGLDERGRRRAHEHLCCGWVDRLLLQRASPGRESRRMAVGPRALFDRTLRQNGPYATKLGRRVRMLLTGPVLQRQ